MTDRLYTQADLDAAVAAERKAAADYCWQRYKGRDPLNLSSPAVFTSHEHQKIVEHMVKAADQKAAVNSAEERTRRYGVLRETIKTMNAHWNPDLKEEWTIPDTVAEQALMHLSRYEGMGLTCPVLLPDKEGEIAFVWDTGEFKLYQVFCCDGIAHFFFPPNRPIANRSLEDVLKAPNRSDVI